MPLYFFHVVDGVEHLDDIGLDFRDDAAARGEAVRTFGEIIRDRRNSVGPGECLSLWVVDQAGNRRGTLTLTVDFPGID